MRTIKNFLAAAILLSAISATIYGGDIGTPGSSVPPPTPAPSSDIVTPGIQPPTPGDIGTPGCLTLGDKDTSSELLTEALLAIISVFR